MTPKELVDKITLAAEQLESLRTEHDLPVSVQICDEYLDMRTSNKASSISVTIYHTAPTDYCIKRLGKLRCFDTYEELVEDIKNR